MIDYKEYTLKHNYKIILDLTLFRENFKFE